MSKHPKYFVYVHCKPDGIPFYVGKGNQERIKYVVRDNQHHINVVAKYGLPNIQVITYQCATEKEALNLEVQIIRILRHEMGYVLANMTDGGEGSSGFVQTEEHIRKRLTPESRIKAIETVHRRIAEGTVNPGPPEGFEHTEETRRKISEQSVRMHAERTPEEKALIYDKISVANTGRKHTEESKEKNRQWHLGRKQTHATKKKRAEALTGLTRSEYTRALMSHKARAREAQKKLERELGIAPVHPNKGRKYTEEQRLKMKIVARKWRSDKKAKESQEAKSLQPKD